MAADKASRRVAMSPSAPIIVLNSPVCVASDSSSLANSSVFTGVASACAFKLDQPLVDDAGTAFGCQIARIAIQNIHGGVEQR